MTLAHRPQVGIVGGGQLARMTYDASLRLGVDAAVLAGPGDDATIGHAHDITVADPTDERALRRFAARCDVITFDHEKVPPEAVARLEGAGHVVRPGRRAFTAAADKAAQRATLHRLGLPVPDFTVVGSLGEVTEFGVRHGWPIVVKAARGGYDGRGVFVIDDPSDVGPIAGAGGAAHLPGMLASVTTLPVIGVPVGLPALGGIDSLLSIVSMPAGVPVATVGVDNAANAGLLAVRILSLDGTDLARRLAAHAAALEETVHDKDRRVASIPR